MSPLGGVVYERVQRREGSAQPATPLRSPSTREASSAGAQGLTAHDGSSPGVMSKTQAVRL
jgi:hypothetical protein